MQMRASWAKLLSLTTFCGAWGHAGQAFADDKEQCAKAYVDAQTLRGRHQLLAAKSSLLMCTRDECATFMRGQMVRDCTEWLTQLQSSVPTIVLAARGPSGEDALGASASIDDGASVPLDGRAIEVEPGQHVFEFSWGNERLVKTVLVLEGAKSQLVLATFGAALAAAPRLSQVAPARSSATQDEAGNDARFISKRTLVPLSIGAVGILTGTVFGALALRDKSMLDANCPSGHCAPPAEQSDIDALHRNAWISNVAFGVGLVGVTTGIVIWLSHRPPLAAGVAQPNGFVQVGPLIALDFTGGTAAGLSGRF